MEHEPPAPTGTRQVLFPEVESVRQLVPAGQTDGSYTEQSPPTGTLTGGV